MTTTDRISDLLDEAAETHHIVNRGVRGFTPTSASLQGAAEVDLSGQGVYDPFLGTSHLGILASPTTWATTLAFLTDGTP